ncbi:hypothetical protein K491DRAFT_675566 [Lophiostoma macrostomum CBS 122681]|uniref:Uncharacterized protein n=1 Tax=Lophiostoma macrostomum CBS 122681 TaxID=1314788 RepID=A0A6A6TJJ8_9PLEO|nr:hypothetical protein K491DRAFT_675566 [Lophiostoma macrostomum CBS 122681]
MTSKLSKEKMASSSSPYHNAYTSSPQAYDTPETPPSSPPFPQVSPIAFKLLAESKARDSSREGSPDSQATETASDVTIDDPDRPIGPYDNDIITLKRGIAPGATYFQIAYEEMKKTGTTEVPSAKVEAIMTDRGLEHPIKPKPKLPKTPTMLLPGGKTGGTSLLEDIRGANANTHTASPQWQYWKVTPPVTASNRKSGIQVEEASGGGG